jgi:uncharacterized membrane protein
MSVLKWLLIILGVLVLFGVVAIVGTLYWASTVESVKLTEADLQVGGAYPPEERQQVLDVCAKRRKPGQDGDDRCVCIADRAGTDFSRFERLILTATLEGSPTKIVAITKGLIASGVSQEKSEALEKESEKRFEALMKTCGFAE